MGHHPDTVAVHGGYRADPATGAVVPPIYQTTSYMFESTDRAIRLFELKEAGYTYTRTSSPGREVLEKRLATLDDGVAALAVASGTAAALYAVLNLAENGDNIVVDDSLPGTEAGAFLDGLARFGVDVRVVPRQDPQAFAAVTDHRTRAYYGQSLSLADLSLLPIQALAQLGRDLGVPLLVDNSLSPVLIRPGPLGAAVVIYSVRGFLAGHGQADGGVIIDTGRFDWEAWPDRIPTLNHPDPSYHGAVWVDVVRQWGPVAFIARLRGRMLRDLGGAISPFDVFQILQGVETLPLRVRAQTDNARQVGRALHDGAAGLGVEVLAQAGPFLRLGLASGINPPPSLIAPVGDAGQVRSTLVPGGAGTGIVLVSVGLEHPDDILADLVHWLGDGI